MADYFNYGTHIKRASDNARIPLDPGNFDYCAYLAWMQAGGVPDTAPAPALEERRTALKGLVTAYRWGIETGGVVLTNGVHVLTSTDDQNRITATIAAMEAIGLQSIDFKASSGWITLTLAQLGDIRRAIGLHVQACFTAERTHHEALDALDAAGLDFYDINTRWPPAATNLLEN